MPSNARLTLQELQEMGLLNELARVFSERPRAMRLLLLIGYPEAQVSRAGIPLDFWLATCSAVEAGLTQGGLSALLAAAAGLYPFNERLAPWRGGRSKPGSRPTNNSTIKITSRRVPLTLQEFDRNGLLNEIASIFNDENAATSLLETIGFPRDFIPNFMEVSNPRAFWRSVSTEIENGLVAGGLEALLDAAAETYPYNRNFAPYRIVEYQPHALPESTHQEKRNRIFLCHAKEDKPRVRRLYQRLKADGLQPWLDEFDLLPGQNWEAAIDIAMRRSHAVIVCLSRSSVEKTGFVQKEIRTALDILAEQPEERIFLIPARLEECIIPQRLSRIQWVDLFRRLGYDRLVQALRSHVVKK